MVQAAEAIGNVTFYEPRRPFPGIGYFPQCGMTASAWAEPVGAVRELGLVVRLQEEPDYFTYQLVHGHAVGGFFCRPLGHRPLVGVDAPVGQQVQLHVEELSVQLATWQAFPTTFTEDT